MEQTADTCHNMNELHKYVEWKGKIFHTVWLQFCAILKYVPLIKGKREFSGVMKMFCFQNVVCYTNACIFQN